MKKAINLIEADSYYLLFTCNDIMYDIEANQNEDLLETICNDLDVMIESFTDHWNYSTEEHYTKTNWIQLTPENLSEYPEYVDEWINQNESRWKIVTE